ncbi:MAG: hypothetical protein WED83_03870, partial [Acidimicrobiia bacterium]
MKLLNRRFLALLAVLVMVIAACGDGETTDTTAEGGTGTTTSGDDLVVGISWNNYAQPRWAKADGPAIIAAVEAAGGTVLEKDANDSSEQQLA